MAEQNELHFETIDRNKDINLQRNKLKFLEDRIATLEKTLESHAKILARFQMTEANEQDFEQHEKLWTEGDNNAK